MCGNMKFILSIDQDISQVSEQVGYPCSTPCRDGRYTKDTGIKSHIGLAVCLKADLHYTIVVYNCQVCISNLLCMCECCFSTFAIEM